MMVFLASQYSQFWNEYCIWFIFGCGILITNMTGNFNLKACSKLKYQPLYFDPFVFCVILYLDYNRVFSSTVIASLYVYMVV